MANQDNNKIVPIVNVQKAISIVPRNVEDIKELTSILAKSSFIPSSYTNKHGDIFAAIYMGLGLGLDPLQALQNIAVITESRRSGAIWSSQFVLTRRYTSTISRNLTKLT